MKKVIGFLEHHSKPLRTLEDLEDFKKEFRNGGKKGRKGIGKKTWDKIGEIVQYGKLQRIESLKSDPKIRTVLEFNKIWGVGAATAGNLWKKGFRSIYDLRSRVGMAGLNSNQRV